MGLFGFRRGAKVKGVRSVRASKAGGCASGKCVCNKAVMKKADQVEQVTQAAPVSPLTPPAPPAGPPKIAPPPASGIRSETPPVDTKVAYVPAKDVENKAEGVAKEGVAKEVGDEKAEDSAEGSESSDA